MERQNKIITVCIIYQFLLGVKDWGWGQGIEWGRQDSTSVSDICLGV